jgi:predicted alpha/beta superfamily hydrolase
LFVRFLAAPTLLILLLAGCAPKTSPVPDGPASAARVTRTPAPVAAYVLDDTEVRDLPSRILQRDYQLYVSFPESYQKEPDRRYPVLFVTDARYAFPLIRSIGRRVGDHGKGLEDFILIGLSYAKGDTPKYSRDRDYTPTTENAGRNYESGMPGRPLVYGQAEAYRRFIAEEVFPFVARTYRADMDRKILAGHSYGGLFGVHVLLTEPTMFEYYILGSPSLWFNRKVMFQREKDYAATHADMPAEVFMGIGSFETINPGSDNPRYHRVDDMVRDLHSFEHTLKSRRYPGLRIQSTVIDDEDHLTVFPAIITRGLTRVLGRTPASG